MIYSNFWGNSLLNIIMMLVYILNRMYMIITFNTILCGSYQAWLCRNSTRQIVTVSTLCVGNSDYYTMSLGKEMALWPFR